jgi:hypothetical protein
MDLGPTAARRYLGRRLKELREEAFLSIEEVVVHRTISMSKGKLYKIESGRISVKASDVVVLAHLYGASDAVRAQLITLTEGTRVATWWHEDEERVIGSSVNLYMALEPHATRILNYQNEVVPGIFQTREYAEALFERPSIPLTQQEITWLIERRLRRQSLLKSAKCPAHHIVIDEGALRRHVGGPAVLARQVEHIRETARHPRLTVEVVPFSVGPQPTVYGPIGILEFADAKKDPPIVCLERLDCVTYRSKTKDIERYRDIFQELSSISIPIEEFA